MDYSGNIGNWPEWEPGEFRDQIMALQEAALQPRIATLRSIKAVGAVITRAGKIFARDTAILKNTAKYLIDSGIGFSDDVTVDVVNLKDRRDYLAENVPADLHVFCYVYSPRPAFLMASGMNAAQTNAENDRTLREAWENGLRDPVAYFHKQSGQHYLTNAWAQAAARQQAKIIATYGGSDYEINTAYFRTQEFQTLISSEAEFSAGDTPTPRAYGFILEKEFLRQNGQQLSPITFLGRQARAFTDNVNFTRGLSPR